MVGPFTMFAGGTTPPWQAFQSQLDPHDGSQKSPGHQFGVGAACASVTLPRPTNPKPAAITAVAIAQFAYLFMVL
jgi:hypothetical protein